MTVLMSNRTTEAYKSVFNYIHQNVLPLDASAIITDFEYALRNGLKATVPSTPLLGCWFHHCQCLRRKVASFSDLFELIKRNKEAHILYRKFQCLALLPASEIKAAFDQLAYEALVKFKQFEKFIRYYEMQWIMREGPTSYSVFMQVSLVINILIRSFFTVYIVYSTGYTNYGGRRGVQWKMR